MYVYRYTRTKFGRAIGQRDLQSSGKYARFKVIRYTALSVPIDKECKKQAILRKEVTAGRVGVGGGGTCRRWVFLPGVRLHAKHQRDLGESWRRSLSSVPLLPVVLFIEEYGSCRVVWRKVRGWVIRGKPVLH